MNPDMTPSKENKYNKAEKVHDSFKYFVIEPEAGKVCGAYSKKDAIEVAKSCLSDEVYICEAIAKAIYVSKIVKI